MGSIIPLTTTAVPFYYRAKFDIDSVFKETSYKSRSCQTVLSLRQMEVSECILRH